MDVMIVAGITAYIAIGASLSAWILHAAYRRKPAEPGSDPRAALRRRTGLTCLALSVVLTLSAKTGWREVEIGRGSSEQTCPVHALEQWMHFAKVDFGPVFVRTSRDGKKALEARLSDKHVARLIKGTVLKSGIRAELPQKDRLALFSGHSLRAGLASSAEVEERYVQKQLGHASAEMTRRYQRRRERFRVNLTKAAGL